MLKVIDGKMRKGYIVLIDRSIKKSYRSTKQTTMDGIKRGCMSNVLARFSISLAPGRGFELNSFLRPAVRLSRGGNTLLALLLERCVQQ